MRMMFLTLSLLLSQVSLAQIDISTEREKREREKAAKDDGVPDDFLKGTGIRLSPRYFKGEVLVYDCRDRHFVCTSMESATECREERDRFLAKDRFELPCAPIKRFKNHEACGEEQYKRVHDIPDKRWCYNEKKLRF
tara:strand:+ start:3905 stop:4315 length:411 start_codon:yes stop_codon:yes gene_type:complete